jgi:hypothetical protein
MAKLRLDYGGNCFFLPSKAWRNERCEPMIQELFSGQQYFVAGVPAFQPDSHELAWRAASSRMAHGVKIYMEFVLMRQRSWYSG